MEQVLIGQNAGVIWHILDGKKSVELSHLKKESKLSDASSGLLSVGCLRKTNFPSLQKK